MPYQPERARERLRYGMNVFLVRRYADVIARFSETKHFLNYSSKPFESAEELAESLRHPAEGKGVKIQTGAEIAHKEKAKKKDDMLSIISAGSLDKSVFTETRVSDLMAAGIPVMGFADKTVGLMHHPMEPHAGGVAPESQPPAKENPQDEFRPRWYAVIGKLMHTTFEQVLSGSPEIVFTIRKSLAFLRIVNEPLMFSYLYDFFNVANLMKDNFANLHGRWFPEVRFTFKGLRRGLKEVIELKKQGILSDEDLKEYSLYRRRSVRKRKTSPLMLNFHAVQNSSAPESLDTKEIREEDKKSVEQRERVNELVELLIVVDFLHRKRVGFWTSTISDEVYLEAVEGAFADSKEPEEMLDLMDRIRHTELMNWKKLKKKTYTFETGERKGRTMTHLQALGEFLVDMSQGKYRGRIYDFKTELTGGIEERDLETNSEELAKAIIYKTKELPRKKVTVDSIHVDSDLLAPLRRRNAGNFEEILTVATPESQGDTLLSINGQHMTQLSAMLYGMLVWAEAVCVFNDLDILSTPEKRVQFMKAIDEVGIIQVRYPITQGGLDIKGKVKYHMLRRPTTEEISVDILSIPTSSDEYFNILMRQIRYWRTQALAEYARLYKNEKTVEQLAQEYLQEHGPLPISLSQYFNLAKKIFERPNTKPPSGETEQKQ